MNSRHSDDTATGQETSINAGVGRTTIPTSISPQIQQSSASTTPRLGKRPWDWDDILHPTPPCKTRILDASPSPPPPSLDTDMIPANGGHSHRERQAGVLPSNALDLDLSPISNSYTAFSGSPARSIMTISPDEDEDQPLEKGKGKEELPPILSETRTWNVRWSQKVAASHSAPGEDIDELYAETDNSIDAIPRLPSPRFPLLPILHPSIPSRLSSPFQHVTSGSQSCSVQPQPSLSPIMSPAPVSRPTSSSSATAGLRFRVKSVPSSSSVTTEKQTRRLPVDSSKTLHVCGYMPPGGGEACRVTSGKKPDMVRHINETHAVSEAVLVARGELALELASRYLGDLAGLIIKSSKTVERSSKQSEMLIMQALLSKSRIKTDGTAFDFDGLEVFRKEAETRARTHRRMICVDCGKDYGSDRSLSRHQSQQRHGRFKLGSGTIVGENSEPPSPPQHPNSAPTSSSGVFSAVTGASKSSQSRPRPASNQIGQRQPWKVKEQSTTIIEHGQPQPGERRISLSAFTPPPSQSIVKEED